MIYDDEEYIDVPDSGGKYKASKSGKIIKIENTNDGEKVTLRDKSSIRLQISYKGKVTKSYVSNIIFRLFNGDLEKGQPIFHIDGDLTNNNANNLTTTPIKRSYKKGQQESHINGEPTNNDANNLKWSTGGRDTDGNFTKYIAYSENVQYSTKIREEHRKEFYKKAQYKCGICKKQLRAESLCLDHNHKTGNIRGVLCRNCNVGLGFFQDNIAILKSATEYLLETDVYKKGVIYNKAEDIKSNEIMGSVASGLVSFETASEVLRVSRKKVKAEYKKFIEETKLFCNLISNSELITESIIETIDLRARNIDMSEEDLIIYQWIVGLIKEEEAMTILDICRATLYNRKDKLMLKTADMSEEELIIYQWIVGSIKQEEAMTILNVCEATLYNRKDKLILKIEEGTKNSLFQHNSPR